MHSKINLNFKLYITVKKTKKIHGEQTSCTDVLAMSYSLCSSLCKIICSAFVNNNKMYKICSSELSWKIHFWVHSISIFFDHWSCFTRLYAPNEARESAVITDTGHNSSDWRTVILILEILQICMLNKSLRLDTTQRHVSTFISRQWGLCDRLMVKQLHLGKDNCTICVVSDIRNKHF